MPQVFSTPLAFPWFPSCYRISVTHHDTSAWRAVRQRTSSIIPHGKSTEPESGRTFEAKDENVWGKVGKRLRERDSPSSCLLNSLHMAREPSVGSCFRHFQSRNGQLITQILPSLHRIEKFYFAHMSPKNGKKHRNWGWKHEFWGLWA